MDLTKIVQDQLAALFSKVESLFDTSSCQNEESLRCIVDAFEKLVETKAMPVSLEVDDGTDYELEKTEFCAGKRPEITFWLRFLDWGMVKKNFWVTVMSIMNFLWIEVAAIGSSFALSCKMKSKQLHGIIFLLLQMFVVVETFWSASEYSKTYYADKLKALIKKLLPADVRMEEPVQEEDGRVLRIKLVRDMTAQPLPSDPSLKM
tara:strand:- start:276 stop:890 length:615 start_codon:yes stop_codon:yes gene_type:complete